MEIRRNKKLFNKNPMKKTFVLVLGIIAFGASNAVFAAANPFSDVPKGHWAYDAVGELVAKGVINGYGDDTFRGDRNITRFEMAQMVAKAMAKQNVGASDKALIDKLAAEFRDELDNLGVRVAKLEKHADMVQWKGLLRYTYGSERHEYRGNSAKYNSDQLVLRLEPKMEVNSNWNVHARIDAGTNLKTDESGNLALKRAWAEGDYNQFKLKFGKIGLYTNEQGLLFDDEFSGGEVDVFSKDKKFRASLMAGRINVTDTKLYTVSNNVLRAADRGQQSDYFGDKAANFFGVNLQYGKDKGLFGGLGYYRMTNEVFLMTDKASANNSKANIWSVNLGYRFDKNFKLWGAYAKNTNAKDSTVFDGEDKSWQVEADYKGAKYENKGTWGAYLAYKRLGATTSLLPTTDGAGWGQKGWEVGARFVPLKNVLVTGKYFHGNDTIYSGGNSAKKLFGRIEMFF